LNQLNRLHAIWNPHVYHGWGKTKRYFEGWYYKIVSKDQNNAFAIIPGIAMDEHGNKQSFIQVLDGKNHEAVTINLILICFCLLQKNIIFQ